MRRESGCGHFSAFRLQNRLHPLRGLKALSDGDKAAHEVADHVVQKRIARKIKPPICAFAAFAYALNMDAVQSFHRAQRLAA